MFCPYEIFQQFLGNMKILRKLWMCFEGIILVKSSKVSQYYLLQFQKFFFSMLLYTYVTLPDKKDKDIHTTPLRDDIALFFTREEYDTSLESSN